MAAGLMRQSAGPNIHITSAGTHATTVVNDLSAQVLAVIGVDMTDHRPIQLTDQMIDESVVVHRTQSRR
jgi:arsenate-mycothiol transferase